MGNVRGRESSDFPRSRGTQFSVLGSGEARFVGVVEVQHLRMVRDFLEGTKEEGVSN